MKKFALFIAATFLFASSTFAKTNDINDLTASTSFTKDVNSADNNNVVIKKIDEKLKGSDILPAIVNDYEGKVVLIDFWATWCGPCRAAMKKLDTIKPELQKKGVVFLYVTGETSPLKTWENMIAEIKGHHYRLTNAQWNDLCAQLNIPGIPAYMLLNKDGSVAYSNLSTGGYPGNDILQNNIEVALTK